MMVIVKLLGGLGNQMFQYAAGRRLAHMLGIELKLDITGFAYYTSRNYNLGSFKIKENFASKEEIIKLTVRDCGLIERITRRILKRPAGPPSTYIRERPPFLFAPKILNVTYGVYLDGYWQCEKYISDIAGIIRQEFTVKHPQTGKNKELADMIASYESVSLHIRRGDYVTDPKINQVHGTCDLDYYHRCVEYLAKEVRNPHFFIFSDEPKWACDNLKLPYPMTFVTHNGAEKSYEDLRLMSQCRHNIIANSSFSWWGAWLNACTDKIVMAPKKWFNDPSINTDDLIPENWTRI